MIYCRKCADHKDIIGFDRDDPVLSCGHVKRRQDTRQAKQEIEKIFQLEAQRRNVTPHQVRDEYLRSFLHVFDNDVDTTVGCCKFCGVVTVMKDSHGTHRCGGNLDNSPGCGMPLDVIEHKVKT
jgi:hypothetical protein